MNIELKLTSRRFFIGQIFSYHSTDSLKFRISIDEKSYPQKHQATFKIFGRYMVSLLKLTSKFTGKHLRLRRATLLKTRLWHRYFPVNFTKFLRTCFLQNTSRRLLLNVEISEKFKIHFMWVKDLKCFKEDFKGNLMLHQAGSGGAFLTPAYFDPK